MKRFTKYLDGVTIVFSSMALLFAFMFASAYFVLDDISTGSSAKMVEEQHKKID